MEATLIPADSAVIGAWVGGVLTPMDKLAVHRQGLRHPAVSVFVMAGQDMLIQQRAHGKYHSGGLWANACCTHPHWQEPALACAHRRLGEELGLVVPGLISRGQLQYRADVGNGMVEDEEVHAFFCRLPERPALRPDPQEVAAVDWLPLDRLQARVLDQPQAFTPWLRIYLERHARQLWGD